MLLEVVNHKYGIDKPINKHNYKLFFSESEIGKTYPVLLKDGRLEMVITEYMIKLYSELLSEAKGDILILGLGLGLCEQILGEVTFIEKYPKVIDLVKPKSMVILGDAFELQLNKKYDFVFDDITEIGKRDFEKFLKPNGILKKFQCMI